MGLVMVRSFNTAGPCILTEHYMLPPERRLGRTLDLIDKNKYFVLRAGRQTGKTTSARWLVKHFNGGGHHRRVWIDIQTARDRPRGEEPGRRPPCALTCPSQDSPNFELRPITARKNTPKTPAARHSGTLPRIAADSHRRVPRRSIPLHPRPNRSGRRQRLGEVILQSGRLSELVSRRRYRRIDELLENAY